MKSTTWLASPRHQDVLRRLAPGPAGPAREIRDVGFLARGCEIHSRSIGSTPYEIGHDRSRYPMERVMSRRRSAASRAGIWPLALRDPDSAVRYWGVLAALMRETGAGARRGPAGSSAPPVRIASGGGRGHVTGIAERPPTYALPVLMEYAHIDSARNPGSPMLALNAIDALGTKSRAVAGRDLAALNLKDPTCTRASPSIRRRLVDHILVASKTQASRARRPLVRPARRRG